MEKRMKRSLLLIIIFMLLLLISTEEESVLYAASATEGLRVDYHTQAEILNYVSQHPAYWADNTYAKAPSDQIPYDAGELSAETLQDAINVLNQVRYIAGIPAVKLKPEYTRKAQAAALVISANGTLDHSPEKPAGMDDATYQLGKEGAMGSNLASGESLVYSVHLWMSDSDKSNISMVGHRRDILEPGLKETGFGAVNSMSAVYVPWAPIDPNYNRVAWPSQNMPIEFFYSSDAWSIFIKDDFDPESVQVTLKRGDNKTWLFSRSRSDGYFNAYAGCIIFRPDNGITYKSGDHFEVTIQGVYDLPLVYTVDFFSICNGKHNYTTIITEPPTCIDYGWQKTYCTVCGEGFNGAIGVDPIDHAWDSGVITKPATKTSKGIKTYTCKVCGAKKTKRIDSLSIPNKPSIKKPKATKNSITVRWSHFRHSTKKTWNLWKKIKKVQIQCAKDKSFNNIVKTLSVRKSKTKAVVKGLKKKKTYYVRVRYYDGKRYSSWSRIRKIKTK